MLNTDMRTITHRNLALALLAMLMSPLASAQLTSEQLKALRERASLPAPRIGFDELHGVHEADVPERVGIPHPTMKMVLECSGTSCKLLVGGMRQDYPNPGT